MGTVTDLSVLQRIVAHETDALAELYDRHSRLLFGVILRIVSDRAEAEEILQDAFVRVWTRAETYDARVGGALPWIVRLARNRAIDRLRARRTRAGIDAPAPDSRVVQAPARNLTSAEGYPIIDFCCVEPVPMLLSTAEMQWTDPERARAPAGR